MSFDRITGVAALIGDTQGHLITLHRRETDARYFYDLQIHDHDDMIAYAGMDRHQLLNVARSILNLLHGE